MENLPDKTNPRIAYFSMEVGLDESIPTYSGGLGILAGDMLKSCADLGVPIIGVTLLNGKGFFKQVIDADGYQTEAENSWDPSGYMERLKDRIKVPIEGTNVDVCAWLYQIEGFTGGRVPVLFLDTNLQSNEEEYRDLTAYLYGGDQEYRLKQEVILGIGGLRMLKKLGYKIKKYHMNEGHSSLLALELLKMKEKKNSKHPKDATKDVRSMCIFTTHTPVPAGHDKFSYELVERILGGYMDVGLIREHCCWEHLNMTLLGFNLSGYINGVAKKHGEVSRSMFPDYTINSITNGIHPGTWASESFQKLYDKYIPDWRRDPFLYRYAVGIPDRELWDAHMKSKKVLIDYVNKEFDTNLGYRKLTFGFGRRMTAYKRPTFIFRDIERLKRISEEWGLQLIFSGKAHPKDEVGKKLIRDIIEKKKELEGQIEIAYIPNYDMGVAKKLVAGVDVWLNNPQRPNEASGTSGMKSVINGVLNLSVLDGWWVEGHIEDFTGWAIQFDGVHDTTDGVGNLYTKLHHITQMYYLDRKRWINIMRNAISLNASFFNSQRMVQQYITDAYWL